MHIYEYKGIPLTEYCKQAEISYSTAYRKIIDGLSVDEAVEYAQNNKGKKARCQRTYKGIPVIKYIEDNYNHPISAYLLYCKLKSDGFNDEKIMSKLEKYKSGGCINPS